MRLRTRAVLGLLRRGACLAPSIVAVAAMAAAHARPSTPPPGSARGVEPPLFLAIEGLRSGDSVAGSGERPFGLCWRGGTPPYELKLVAPDGQVVLDARTIDGLAFVSPSAVRFQAGTYDVTVVDAKGYEASGQFTAVDSATLPATSDSAEAMIRRAQSLTRNGEAGAYEAYLGLLSVADRGGRPVSQALAQLCGTYRSN